MQDMPWDPAVLAGPHPPNVDHPLVVPPESPVWTLRFLMQRVHQRLLGQGRWVWVDEGGGGRPPGQALAGGRGPRVVELATGVARAEMGGNAPPLPEKGVKMFELAQPTFFTPEKKKGGGAPNGYSSPCAGRCCDLGGWSLRGGPRPGRRPGRR